MVEMHGAVLIQTKATAIAHACKDGSSDNLLTDWGQSAHWQASWVADEQMMPLIENDCIEWRKVLEDTQLVEPGRCRPPVSLRLLRRPREEQFRPRRIGRA